MFTWRHLLWLAICVCLIVFIVYEFKKRKPSLDRVLTTTLTIALLSETAKMTGVIELVPSQNGELLLPYLPMNHLPLHFCSIQILLIIAVKLIKSKKKKETLLAFMAPTCVLGGIMALLMPSIFTTTISVEQAFTSIMSYQFFIFHTMIIAFGIIIAKSDWVDWDKKHYKNTVLLVYLLGFISIYLNSILASPNYVDGKLVSVDFWTNFFFTYQNPIGLKLTAIWQWYLYLVIIMLLTAGLVYLFYWPLIRKNKKN